jgi:hypothetical protein
MTGSGDNIVLIINMYSMKNMIIHFISMKHLIQQQVHYMDYAMISLEMCTSLYLLNENNSNLLTTINMFV